MAVDAVHLAGGQGWVPVGGVRGGQRRRDEGGDESEQRNQALHAEPGLSFRLASECRRAYPGTAGCHSEGREHMASAGVEGDVFSGARWWATTGLTIAALVVLTVVFDLTDGQATVRIQHHGDPGAVHRPRRRRGNRRHCRRFEAGAIARRVEGLSRPPL